MKSTKPLVFSPLTWLLLASTSAWSADSPRLAAPIPPGAVPGVPAAGLANTPRHPGNFGGVSGLDCRGMSPSTNFDGRPMTPEQAAAAGDSGPWCFLSRDPIEKVKAFYEKAIGPTRTLFGTWGRTGSKAVQGYTLLTERAWFPGGGESAPGFDYRGVSLHALPPPPVKGPAPEVTAQDEEDGNWAGMDAFKFYGETRHFGYFNEGIDWFGDPTKRKPEELDAVYRKYAHLESALFPRVGPNSEFADEALAKKNAEQQQQIMSSVYAGMVPSQAQIEQMKQGAAAPPPASTGPSPEDAEFNAIMQRNPEVARKYTALTRRFGELMQQGKWDEADAVDEELQELIESNPELAAFEERQNQRDAQVSAGASAAEAKKMQAAQHSQSTQSDKANWGIWLDYLKTLDKDAYYTLIVIDDAFRGDEKDYSRDQSLIAQSLKSGYAPDWFPHQEIWGFKYPYDQTTATAPSPVNQSGEPAQPEGKQDSLQENAKKGWRALKRVF